MLTLRLSGIEDHRPWEEKGYSLPAFDPAAVAERTRENPRWIHFGAGNIFRGYVAALQHRLLDMGLADSGILVAESFDPEILPLAYRPVDNLSLLVTMLADGGFEKSVVASVGGSLSLGEDWGELRRAFANPGLQLASFTVTEKGYALGPAPGQYFPDVQRDLEAGPERPSTLMAALCALLLHRWRNGAVPIALVSMDNCSHNGDKLRAAVLEVAERWIGAGLCEAGFQAYLEDPSRAAFPLTMIDKITPGPSPRVAELLGRDGVEGAAPFTTTKGTHTAIYVNAEKPQYLVVEDRFPNGRPPLEQAGVYFTDRSTVDRSEKMKVCTCLNPLHTALAVFGCLLGIPSIAAEMEDPALRALVERLGYVEGLPVVVDPGIFSPREFLDQVVRERLPNPNIPDIPGRIATDTSQKVAIRFGETLKAYRDRGLDTAGLLGIPLAIAGWCRYLLGVDDNLEPMVCSPDPRLEELQGHLAGVRPGEAVDVHSKLHPILSDSGLFGLDLYEAGIGDKVEDLFCRMTTGKAAVRATLDSSLL